MRQLELTGAKAVVAHPSLLETVRAAAARVPAVAEVACTGGDALPEGVLSFDELLRTGREETPSVDVDLQKDPLMLLFSSGTTGLPKGVTLTNYTLGSVLLQTSNKDFGWERLGNDHIPFILPTAGPRSSVGCRGWQPLQPLSGHPVDSHCLPGHFLPSPSYNRLYYQ